MHTNPQDCRRAAADKDFFPGLTDWVLWFQT
jgi:hypothetical protein